MAIDDWCMANLDELENCGIYIEHPNATIRWSHWTIRAPKSGRRYFSIGTEMLNPYTLLVAALIWLASLAGVGYWQHGAGVAAQKVADQKQFDKVNADITAQKTKANTLYRAAQADIIALQTDRDQFKNQLEKSYAKNQAATAALRDKYAGVGLRFATGQASGCGPGGAGAMPPAAGTARIESAAVIQLPDALAENLRRLAADADRLADGYRKCYGWATGVK